MEIPGLPNNTTGNLKKRISSVILSPGGQSNSRTSFGPDQIKRISLGRVIIESDARSTGVQFKSAAKLSIVIMLITKHADGHKTFISQRLCLFSKMIIKISPTHYIFELVL